MGLALPAASYARRRTPWPGHAHAGPMNLAQDLATRLAGRLAMRRTRAPSRALCTRGEKGWTSGRKLWQSGGSGAPSRALFRTRVHCPGVANEADG